MVDMNNIVIGLKYINIKRSIYIKIKTRFNFSISSQIIITTVIIIIIVSSKTYLHTEYITLIT